MNKFRAEDADNYHASLYALVENINRLAPMARSKDRDEEAKMRFLREAVQSRTEWGLIAAARVTEKCSYQIHISSMHSSLRYLAIFKKSNNKKNVADQHVYMRK